MFSKTNLLKLSLLVIITVALGFMWTDSVLALGSCDSGYRVNPGGTQKVDCYDPCEVVENNGSESLFIPTNTSNEWTEFKLNAPNIGTSDCCECSSGSCCDGCDYRSSSYVCDSSYQVDYECRYGTDCGEDVYRRIKKRYCSGSSASCNGSVSGWQWDGVADYCASDEICDNNDSTCDYESSCVSCSCSWNDQGCGAVGCSSDKMGQRKDCSPSGCNGDGDTRCVNDPSCQTVEPNLTNCPFNDTGGMWASPAGWAWDAINCDGNETRARIGSDDHENAHWDWVCNQAWITTYNDERATCGNVIGGSPETMEVCKEGSNLGVVPECSFGGNPGDVYATQMDHENGSKSNWWCKLGTSCSHGNELIGKVKTFSGNTYDQVICSGYTGLLPTLLESPCVFCMVK